MTEDIFLNKKLTKAREVIGIEMRLFFLPYLNRINRIGNLKYSLKINGPLKPLISTGDDIFVRKFIIELNGKVEKNDEKILKILHEIRKNMLGKRIPLPLPFSKTTIRNRSFNFSSCNDCCFFSVKFYGATYKLKLRESEIKEIEEIKLNDDGK